MASAQTTGLPKTRFLTNFLYSAVVSLLSRAVLVPFSSGRPTEVGVSRRVVRMKNTPTAPMSAGIQKHHCQAPTCWAAVMTAGSSMAFPRLAAMRSTVAGSPARFMPMPPMIAPHSTDTIPAPMECDVFQILILVASSVGGTQCTMRRLHGAKPQPWKTLLRTSRMAISHTMTFTKSGPNSLPEIRALSLALQPKMRFNITQAPSPMTRCHRALDRSARMPLRNFEIP